MQSKTCFMILFLLCGGLSSTAFADDTRERLDKGEIIVNTVDVEGSSIPEATLMAVIDAAPEKVWELVGNCNEYEKNMIRVLKAEELSRSGDTVICMVTTDMPWPLANLTAVTRAKHTVGPPVWSRSWSFIKGDFKSNRGSWRVQAFDPQKKRSLVVYKVHAVPDMMVPDGLIRKAQRDTLPNLIKHLRKKLE